MATFDMTLASTAGVGANVLAVPTVVGNAVRTIEAILDIDAMIAADATIANGDIFQLLEIPAETVVIAAGAEIMRMKCLKVKSKKNAIDVVGTGGDNLGTLNISTAVSFVIAGTGVPVAKHGNYSATSKSGAANVLKALSVNIDCDIETVENCLDKCGICFLLAPKHHSAMKYVGKIRQEIGIRTIFNLLGPLSNPALVTQQLLGVYDRSLIIPFAESLKSLGSTHAWIVHGNDGLDEVTITGDTYCAQLKDGVINEFIINPSDLNMPTSSISELIGGEPDENAKDIKELFTPFHRGKNVQDISGTGLGLSILKKAVELHKGRIEVKSKIGKGSNFKINLFRVLK